MHCLPMCAEPKSIDAVPHRRSMPELRFHLHDNPIEEAVVRFFHLLRLSFWRAFQHDAFAVAKASAYSSILTFFPSLVVVGSVLATSRRTEAYLLEISYAVG